MRRELCKGCGRPRPALAIEQGDDFCSTECARRHYGTLRGERRGLVALRRDARDGTTPARPEGFSSPPRGRRD